MPIEGTIAIIEYNNVGTINNVFIEVDKDRCLEDEENNDTKYYPALYSPENPPVLVRVDREYRITLNISAANLPWAKTGTKVKIKLSQNLQTNGPLDQIVNNNIESISILNSR